MGKGAVVMMLIFLLVNTCLIGFGVADESTIEYMTTVNTNDETNPVDVVSSGEDYNLVTDETYTVEGASEQAPQGIIAFASSLLNSLNQFVGLVPLLLFGYSSIFIILGLPSLLVYILTAVIGLFEIYIMIEILTAVVAAVRGVF